MGRVAIAVGCTLALAVGSQASARAPVPEPRRGPAFQVVANGVRGSETDGRFFLFSEDAASESLPDAFSVLDTRTGRTSPVATPPSCDLLSVTGLSRGVLVVLCKTDVAGERLRLVSARTGQSLRVPVQADAEAQAHVLRAYFERLGRYWIEGSYTSCAGSNKPCGYSVYVNRANGRVRWFLNNDYDGYHSNLDVDDAELREPRSFCDVGKNSSVNAASPPYLAILPFPQFHDDAVRAKRCGARRWIILGRCPLGCDSASLGFGRVTWNEYRGNRVAAIFAYSLRRPTLYRWTLRGREARGAYVFPTRYGIVLQKPGRRVLRFARLLH